MASSTDNSFGIGGNSHPSYELHRSCDKDTNTHGTADTGNYSVSDRDEADYDLSPDLADRLVKRTEMRVAQVVASSAYVQRYCGLYQLPRFEREDFEVGDLIAFGGFSNVFAIQRFNVESELTDPVVVPAPAKPPSKSSSSSKKKSSRSSKNGTTSPSSSSSATASSSSASTQTQQRQYVIKHLNPKLAFNPKKLVVGAKDLVMEAHFLSALDHEHIIKLRGWSAAGIGGFSATGRADGFFLILDRLQYTLAKKISHWREDLKQRKSNSSSSGSIIKTGRSSYKNQLFQERLRSAIDIADAVQYLHERRILFRDLKPANVGFDVDGTLKIFDFGLAVEIPFHAEPETTFKLAGNTGTSRYMAVEVIRKEPYNLKADVFSYSILLWEILALTKPYDGLLGHQVKESVSIFGERPTIPRSWPVAIRRLLRRGWSEGLSNRPTMDEVYRALVKVYEASSKSAASKFLG